MMTRLLDYLDRKGYKFLLTTFCAFVYRLKGYGSVSVKYHPAFRAYEFRVKDISYLSTGPGWAYSFEYLRGLLANSFSHFYMPKHGDCVVDIGAGLGEETAVYSQLVGSTGKIFSIEANPVTFAGLKYATQQNKTPWVTPLNLAVYSSDGEVTIEDSVETYLTNTINSTQPKGFTVPAKTLDSIVREHNIKTIDLLKSNIEGAEQFLIMGMDRSLPIIKHLCISCHDFRHKLNNDGEFYVTKAKVIDFLMRNNFTVTVRNTGDALVDDYVYGENKIKS